MADDNTNVATQAPPPEAVDINDDNLQSQEMAGVNPDQDQFPTIPVVPEGTYRAKLIQKKPDNTIESLWIRVPGTKKKSNSPYLKTGIEAKIFEPDSPYDDWPVFDNFVSTLVMDRTGTNKIVGIIQALGGTIQTPVIDTAIARQLTELLAPEPIAKINVRWEGYCAKCKETVVRGEKKFPEDGNGGHLSTMECVNHKGDGIMVTAQARIEKYLADV